MTIPGLSDPTSTQSAQRPDPPKEDGPAKATPQLVDISKLTSRSAVVQALSDLSSYSSSLDDELVSLFEESEPVVNDARRSISALAPQVQLIQEEAGVLDRRLQSSASVAKRISERVRLLDEERKRIALATEWAVRVAELKSSLSLLAAAVEHRDWDMATMHCRRALAIDPAIRSSRFAAAVVPTADLPEPPESTLLELRKAMLTAFTDAFIRSTQNKDEQEASRFFKLFPQIGWKKEGLDVYSSFARSMVREKGRTISDSLGSGKAQHPTHFALLLTSLFEHLAMLIDMHQPVVDRHYGVGNFEQGVMHGLQEECDRLGHRIMDSWREERNVRRRLDEVQAYRFTGAVVASKTQQSTFKASFGVPGRTASPAAGSTANSSFDEPSGPDGREIDRILTELAAMSSRWDLYRRFLRSRLSPEQSEPDATESSRQKTAQDERAAQADEPLKDFRRTSVDQRSANAAVVAAADASDADAPALESIDIVAESKLGQEVRESMKTIYIPMETWYLRNSLEKAFRIDQPDTTSRPYTSSILDDAFYVIRTVLARILTTSSLATLNEMVRVVKTSVEEEYIEVIVRKMESLWRSISSSMTVDGPRKDAASREMRTVFITYLNVLDVSSNYMSRVLVEVGNEQALARLYEAGDLDEGSAAIHSLSSLVNRFRSSLRTEIEHLFTQLTAPRLRTILTETYRDMSYVLDDESYSLAESRDLVRRRFVKSWEHHIQLHFSGPFTEANYDLYITMALDALLKPWEAMVMGMRFTELGALKFDKDLRAVIGFLTGQTTTAGVRDKFTRLQQVSYVLNLDGAEDEGDLYQNAVSSGISWRLSMAEVKNVRSLRVS